MTIDHVGYAVKNIDQSRLVFESLGFLFEDLIIDTDRNLKIQFGSNGSYRIELLAINNQNEKSPIDLYIQKIGPTPYHICYLTNDISGKVKELRSEGFVLVHDLSSAVAFGGKRVAFLFQKCVGIIELVEE